jgi:NodT family efflux transporter outer membrane factor (OMF) lipoprotein
VAELALNYVELRALQARLTIARDNLARQEETLKLTTWRAQAGLTTELDVEQARANAEQTRAQVPNLETGVAEAEHRLAMLIGQPPAALHERLAVPGSIPTASARVAVGIPADTLRQRPDVRATERRLAAATARLGQAEAARYPSLRLSGSLDVEAASVGGLANGGTLVRSLLGSLTAPLFDRGRIRRQIEIQGAVQEQAVVAWEQAMLTALEDVENALVALDGAQRRQAALADGAAAARNAARLARDQYTAGLASYLTVLVSERSALSLEDELKSSEAASSSALIRLYKALGGGWSTE